MKIRLWGTEDECREAAERLIRTPGLTVLSVSAPYPDRGASVLVRVYVEARLDPPPVHSASTASPVRRTGEREADERYCERAARRLAQEVLVPAQEVLVRQAIEAVQGGGEDR